MPIRRRTHLSAIGVALASCASLTAQIEPPLTPPPSLKTAAIPTVRGLENYVRDRDWAILLGKAFFWDQQAGSDGMACASCHFHAGADRRIRNQISPSVLHGDPSRANVFDPTLSGGGGPDYTLTQADFPFRVMADPANRDSAILFDSDDIVSSAGVFKAAFNAVGDPLSMLDPCEPQPDEVFHLGDLNTRRVEPRNTPSVINAIFQFRSFWDGRANNTFNGQSPFGVRDQRARVALWDGTRLRLRPLRLHNAALASQAVGPTLSDFEMSCSGRSFPDVAQKLLPRRALAFQQVALDDSVFAGHVDASGIGLVHSYDSLIELAFQPAWWQAPDNKFTQQGVRQREHNFAMFWGLSIMLYESTLVSDDAPYDRFAEGVGQLTEAQQRGLDVFMHQGACINCHKGADFTGAGLILQAEAGEGALIEHMVMAQKHTALYDNGFYNIGVRPAVDDRGVGGTDPWGNHLSFTRQWLDLLFRGKPLIDGFFVNINAFDVRLLVASLEPTLEEIRRALGRAHEATDGAFKTPSLRNVELTGPFFHNGGYATLEQVVEFYNRGGNRVRQGNADSTGMGTNLSNLDADIKPLRLSAQQQSDLVEFLKSLTDERVRQEMAPFDHPALAIPHGHQPVVDPVLGAPQSVDDSLLLPAIGRGGRAAISAPPLRAFHEQLP